KGETVYLKGESNISAGGDSIDVTDSIRPEVREVAVAAVKAIPDLHHAGVDMIVNEQEAVVIEINSTGSTALHTFPLYGESQNVAEKIIDYYFTETKNEEKSDVLRSEEHTSELQSRFDLVCRLLLEKKKKNN